MSIDCFLISMERFNKISEAYFCNSIPNLSASAGLMNWIQECDFYSELLVSYYKKRKKYNDSYQYYSHIKI